MKRKTIVRKKLLTAKENNICRKKQLTETEKLLSGKNYCQEKTIGRKIIIDRKRKKLLTAKEITIDLRKKNY